MYFRSVFSNYARLTIHLIEEKRNTYPLRPLGRIFGTGGTFIAKRHSNLILFNYEATFSPVNK